jgi:hypothetical protein
MTDHHSRRWFQLSLKSLFLLTLLVATFFAGYALRAKQEAAERQRAEAEAQRALDESRLKLAEERQQVEAGMSAIRQFIKSRQPPLDEPSAPPSNAPP